MEVGYDYVVAAELPSEVRQHREAAETCEGLATGVGKGEANGAMDTAVQGTR